MNQEDLIAKEELLKSLDTPAVREKVKAWSLEVLDMAKEIFSGSVEEFASFKGNWSLSLVLGFGWAGYAPEAFADLVAKLSEPCIITAKELGEAFRVHVHANDERLRSNFDQLYQGFLDHVRLRVLAERESHPLELCEVWGRSDDDDPDIAEHEEQSAKQISVHDAQIATLNDPQLDDAAKVAALREQLKEQIKDQIAALEAGAAIPDPEVERAWRLMTGVAFEMAEMLGETPQLPPYPNFPEAQQKALLWAQNGLTLRVLGRRSVSCPLGKRLIEHGTLLGKISGAMSQGAFSKIADELVPELRSILRSVSLLRPPSDASSEIPENTGLPNIFQSELNEHRFFIYTCTSLLFLPANKKDPMTRRFSNAIRLLSLADKQTTPAIALALSVTAIEALLGKKGPDISALLAENISIILEPDKSHRREAELFVKSLYNFRSKTLHGEKLEADITEAKHARTLAAGCLYGLWHRSAFKVRFEEKPDTLDALLDEIQNLKHEGRVLDGAPDLPAVYALWRNDNGVKG